jgi:hypothetical protein
MGEHPIEYITGDTPDVLKYNERGKSAVQDVTALCYYYLRMKILLLRLGGRATHPENNR